MAWLEREYTATRFWLFLFISSVISITYSFILLSVAAALSALGISFGSGEPASFQEIFTSIFCSPLCVGCEELIARSLWLLPAVYTIFLVRWLAPEETTVRRLIEVLILCCAVVASSLFFAALHLGNLTAADLAVMSPLDLGVYVVWDMTEKGGGGMLLAIVYLKAGGMQGKIFKPFFASSLVHFVHNQFFFGLTGVETLLLS